MDFSQSVGSSEVLGQGVVWHGDSEKLSIDDDFELVGGRGLGAINGPSVGGGRYNEFESIRKSPPITIKEPCFDRPANPLWFRVLFIGSAGAERHKDMVIKKLSEVLASTLPQRKQHPIIINNFREKVHNIVFLDAFDSSPIEIYEDAGLHVIEANFLGPNNMVPLDSYLYTSQQKNERIDLAVYFFSQHISRDQVEQDMGLLQQLDDHAVPIWPLLALPHERPPSATGSRNLRSPSFMRSQGPSSSSISSSSRSELAQSLSDHLDQYKIRTVDLTDINPETPNFMRQEKYQASVPLSVDQFIAIDSEEVAQILEKWRKPRSSSPKNTTSKQGWLASVTNSPTSVTAITLGLVFIVLATAVLAIIRSASPSPPVLSATPEHAAEAEHVHMRLNPMWDVVDDETLRHLFVVELSIPKQQQQQQGNWAKQTLVVVLETDQLMEKEYTMAYEPMTRYNYVVDVPSPCLIHSQEDIVAHVVWRYEEDARTKVEKLVDQIVLSLETCQPVYDRRAMAGECKPQTELTVVRRSYPHISWKHLFGKLKTESMKLTEAMITSGLTLLLKLLK